MMQWYAKLKRRRERKDYVHSLERNLPGEDTSLSGKWVALGKQAFLHEDSLEAVVHAADAAQMEDGLICYVPEEPVKEYLSQIIHEYVHRGMRVTGMPISDDAFQHSFLNEWVAISMNTVLAHGSFEKVQDDIKLVEKYLNFGPVVTYHSEDFYKYDAFVGAFAPVG